MRRLGIILMVIICSFFFNGCREYNTDDVFTDSQEAGLSIYGIWEITEYIGKGIDSHSDDIDKENSEIDWELYRTERESLVGTQLEINQDIIKYCLPAGEQEGDCYVNSHDGMFFGYKPPTGMQITYPVERYYIEWIEDATSCYFIIDAKGVAVVDIKGDFYYLQPVDESDTTEYALTELQKEDFSVSNSNQEIALDEVDWEVFADGSETLQESIYVGELYIGESVYKYYMHQDNDIDIYTSNLYYDEWNRDFDEYHIAQIRLKTSVFKTPRGITIGASWDDVVNVYGPGEMIREGGTDKLIYSLDNFKMEFEFNETGQVLSMEMFIDAELNKLAFYDTK